MSLLSEIDDIRRFKSADQLAAFIGMIPMCHSSGEREGVGDITVRRSGGSGPSLSKPHGWR